MRKAFGRIGKDRIKMNVAFQALAVSGKADE